MKRILSDQYIPVYGLIREMNIRATKQPNVILVIPHVKPYVHIEIC